MIARTRVETIGRCLPPESGKFCTLFYTLWLGHESLETTHVYVEADLATKERALEKLTPMPEMPARYRADDKLLAFLAKL
jgi:hypothetical protein